MFIFKCFRSKKSRVTHWTFTANRSVGGFRCGSIPLQDLLRIRSWLHCTCLCCADRCQFAKTVVTCLGDQLEGLSEVSICAVPEGSRVYRFSNIFLHSVWSCYCESELTQLLTIPYAPNLCGSDLLGSLNGSCSISWRTEDTIESIQIQTISPSQVYRANQRKGQASSDPETLVSPMFLDNPNLRGVIGRHAFCMAQTHIHNLHQFVYKIL